MKTLATIAALAAALVCVPAAPADTCQASGYGHNYQPAAVVAPAVVLPLYGASYTGAGTDDETRDLLKQLLQEVKQMRQDLARPPAPAVPPLGARAAPDVFDVLKQNCVGCHSGDKPRGDFALVSKEGAYLKLSPADRREVIERIEGKGKPVMPPRGKGPDGKPRHELTPAEVQAVKRALTDGPLEDAAERRVPEIPGQK